MLRLRRRYSIHPTPAPSSTARGARIGRDRSERLWRQAYGHRLGLGPVERATCYILEPGQRRYNTLGSGRRALEAAITSHTSRAGIA